ncbi:replication initiation protein [Vibrio vulnificus]|nr:replication initiation protein [Vibrio vulnificus]
MDTKNRIVKKSNGTISSRVKDFSLTQMKIMNLAISELTEDTKPGEVLTFQAVELLKAIGLGEKNHVELRKATLDMIRGIEIPNADGSISQVPVFTDITYNDGGAVDIEFHPKVLPLLVLAKKEYTKYYFENIQRLKSTYSIKLYELCKQYQNTKQKYRDISVDDLKFYLDIPKKSYPRFSNFKQKILLVAIPEINEKTDLLIDFEEQKKGRSVVGIRFNILAKNNARIIEDTKKSIELTPATKKLVQSYLIPSDIAKEIQELATTDEHLFYAIDLFDKQLKNKIKKTGEPDNLARYAEVSLRNSIPVILDSEIVEKLKESELKEKQYQEAQEYDLKKKEDKKNKAQDYIDSLSNDELNKIFEECKKVPGNRRMLKGGVDSAGAMSILRVYVNENILVD